MDLGVPFTKAGIDARTYTSVNDWCKTFLTTYLSHFWKVEFRHFGKGHLLSLYYKQKADTEIHIVLSSPIEKEMEDQEDWYHPQPVPFSSKWKIRSSSKWKRKKGGKFLFLSSEVAHCKGLQKTFLEQYLCKNNKVFPKDLANL